MLKELLKQYRGQRPQKQELTGGLEHFENNLRVHLDRVDYRNRDEQAQKVESALITLAQLRPDLVGLAKRSPILASLLLSIACTTAPVNGELPKEPTAVVLTLPPSDAAANEVVVTNNPDLAFAATPTTRATITRKTPTPTRTATPTKTEVAPKTPTPSATATAEQAATPEQSSAIITCINTVIKRSGPGTGFPQVGTCAAGETINLSTVEGKFVSGGYTWLKVKDSSGEYYIAVISSRMTVDVETVNALPTLKATELPAPPKPTSTPVRQETVAIKTVTIPDGYLLFLSKGADQSGVSVGSQTLTILETSTPWLKINYPGLGIRWVHSANLVISSGTISSVPLQTSPEVIYSEIGNTNPIFPGILSESERVYAQGVDIGSGMVSPWLYDTDGYNCASPVQSVRDNPGETNFQHTFGTPVLFSHIGTVTSISTPDSSGSYTVSFIDQKGVAGSRIINPATKVYLQTHFYNGNTGCVDAKIQSPPSSFFAVGRAAGFPAPGTNYVMGAY